MNLIQAELYVLDALKSQQISLNTVLDIRRVCSKKDKLNLTEEQWNQYFEIIDKHLVKEMSIISRKLLTLPETSIHDQSAYVSAANLLSKKRAYKLVKTYAVQILYIKYHTNSLTRY
ncbi:MAG TPA: hypothetical protein DCL21_00685 [Alphaproteobacteria bacterium]|nr:hypothetical protein [Alphaproteobacteria bacterium]